MNMPTFAFRYRLLFLLIVLGLSYQPGISRAETAGEYQVKAAFLYHFSNFVEWPESTFEPTDGRLRICIIGKDPFGPILDTTLANKTVGDHRFEILRNPPSTQISSCHVLYLPSSHTSNLKALRRQAGKGEVLTVGENLDFIKQGGMVHFFFEEQKVRFAVNPDAVNQTHLKISSKLLRLAKIISR